MKIKDPKTELNENVYQLSDSDMFDKKFEDFKDITEYYDSTQDYLNDMRKNFTSFLQPTSFRTIASYNPIKYIQTEDGVYEVKEMLENGSAICKLNDTMDVEIANEDKLSQSEDLWSMCTYYVIMAVDTLEDLMYTLDKGYFVDEFDRYLFQGRNVKGFGISGGELTGSWRDNVIGGLKISPYTGSYELCLTDYDDWMKRKSW